MSFEDFVMDSKMFCLILIEIGSQSLVPFGVLRTNFSTFDEDFLSLLVEGSSRESLDFKDNSASTDDLISSAEALDDFNWRTSNPWDSIWDVKSCVVGLEVDMTREVEGEDEDEDGIGRLRLNLVEEVEVEIEIGE